MRLLCFVISLTFLRLTTQKASPDSSNTYSAGVIQYKPMAYALSSYVLDLKNAEYYFDMLKSAYTKKIDIIVFPQHGLATIPNDIMLPDKPPSFIKYKKNDNNDYENSINEYSENYRIFYRDDAFVLPDDSNTEKIGCRMKYFNRKKIHRQATALDLISCAARTYSMYVVASHYERVSCNPTYDSNCPSDGFYLYSSTLVFDRQGYLAARYRKHTKFDEPWIDVPEPSEPVIFKTDFNVTFGLLLGLDVLDKNIVDLYAGNIDVHDMILSTSKSELPFFVTAYDQVDWARNAGVNLLVAGFGWDADSNIYTDYKEPMGKITQSTNPNYLVFKNITKMHHRDSKKKDMESNNVEIATIHQIDEVPIFGSEDPVFELMPNNWTLQEFAYEDALAVRHLNLDQGSSLDTHLCSKTLCCDYKVEWTYNDHHIGSIFYKYALVNVRGVYKLLNGSVVSIELCSVMACSDNTDKNCGKRIDPSKSLVQPVIFNSITITRRDIFNITNRITSPLTLTFDGLLADKDFSFYNNITSNRQTLKLKTSIDDLMFFGINTRVFDADKLPANYYDLPKVPHDYYESLFSNRIKWIGIFVACCVFLGFISWVIYCVIYSRYCKRNLYNVNDEAEQPLRLRRININRENLDSELSDSDRTPISSERHGYESEVTRAIDDVEVVAEAIISNDESTCFSTNNPTLGSLNNQYDSPDVSSSVANDRTDVSESLASSSIARSVTLTTSSSSKQSGTAAAAAAVAAIGKIVAAPVRDLRESSEIDSSYFRAGSNRSGRGESTDADVDTIYSSDQRLLKNSDSVFLSPEVEEQSEDVQGGEENFEEEGNLIDVAGESINVNEGVDVDKDVGNDNCDEMSNDDDK